jgi:hypothetical protein
LARDHKVAFCREPKKWWKCKAFGHLSSNCRAALNTLPPTSRSKNLSSLKPSLLDSPRVRITMERRFSLGGHSGRRASPPRVIERFPRDGSTINYPRNPRFRPRLAFKMMAASKEMEDRRSMLNRFALVVHEVGALSLASSDELKDILLYHFGIRKHEVYIYRSQHEPFMVHSSSLFMPRS